MGLDPNAQELIELLQSDGARALADLSPTEARDQLARQVREQDENASGEGAAIPGGTRTIPIRVHRPAGDGYRASLPTLVYCHGGGWVIGELRACAGRAQGLADHAGCLVITVDYRLAPENRFPAALDDVSAAVAWLGEHAGSLGGDPGRLALLGDSSGGNLAAAASLRARDEDGPAIACMVLACPVLDLEFSSESMKSNAEGYLLERRDLHWCWHHYLASEADRHNPYAVPARATSLTGLPPTLIITAEFDPLRDQARAFGERLKREGVPSKVSNYAGVMHAFVEYEQLDQAPAALAETAAFLRRAWDREPGLCP